MYTVRFQWCRSNQQRRWMFVARGVDMGSPVSRSDHRNLGVDKIVQGTNV